MRSAKRRRVEKLGARRMHRRSSEWSQAALDQARTRLSVAERNLQPLRRDREVVEQQSAEGAVLGPGASRALKVPVAEGGVVLAGETQRHHRCRYILRLQLPERHARFIRAGDTILIGAWPVGAGYRDAVARPHRAGLPAN